MRVLFVCCFVQGTRPVNYARDNYWLSSVRLQQKIDEKSFTSIMEMRDAVANLHGIAQRSGMEKQVVDHWLDLLNFLNLLYQNIGNQPQGWALQQISEKWGTNCGISKKNKKLADKIIRDNLKNQVMVPGPVPYMNLPFIPMGILWMPCLFNQDLFSLIKLVEINFQACKDQCNRCNFRGLVSIVIKQGIWQDSAHFLKELEEGTTEDLEDVQMALPEVNWKRKMIKCNINVSESLYMLSAY